MSSRDGEEMGIFYEARPHNARCPGIRPGSAKYNTVANVVDACRPCCPSKGVNGARVLRFLC